MTKLASGGRKSIMCCVGDLKRRGRGFIWAMLGFLIVALSACYPTHLNTSPPPESANNVLRIYWNQGFYPEEDQALEQVIQDWERQSNIKVELSWYSSDDILNQTTVALDSGPPPDIVFAHRSDYTLQPQWAWEGKLADLTDVIEPIRDRYTPGVLESAYLYDKTAQARHYYGIPIELQALHLHYWRDLLAEAGLDEGQIPTDWDAFWTFWQQVQDRLQAQGNAAIFAMGLPMSVQASDTYFQLEQIFEAYDIELVDLEGQLHLSDPGVRTGLIDVMTWLVGLYQDGYVPTEAINWLDSDNNISFLNRQTIMTTNPSLSIPASQQDDLDLYFNKIATMMLPAEPDGEPIRYLVSVKQAVVFADSPNVAIAKDFLAYLVQPERLGTYIKGSLGRWFPPMPELLADPFWQAADDPHIAVATGQFTQQDGTRPFYHVFNPAYAEVQAENVWGQTMVNIIEGMPVVQAVDEAIARIETIFQGWAL